MKRRLAAAAAIGLSATLAMSACSSSSKAPATGSTGGQVTLHFFGADYGTAGTSNSTQQYWQGIADAFHKANPNITVDVQTIDWNDFPTKLKTMLQAKNYPDIIEGDAPQSYAQEGIAYKASDVLERLDAQQPDPDLRQAGRLPGHRVRHPLHHQHPGAVLQHQAVQAGRHRRRRRPPGPSCRPTPPSSPPSATAPSATACPSAPRRRRASPSCGCSAPAAAT